MENECSIIILLNSQQRCDMCEEDKLFLIFGSIKKKIYKLINSRIKEYNVNVTEVIYLLIINEHPLISFKDLTKMADFDKGMTTKVLISLKCKKLVNNSIKGISLTKSGVILSKKIINEFNILKKEILGNVDNEVLSGFYNRLVKFNDMLEGDKKC
jgi:DNA-binding MarR family transcriptional regulator